MNCGEKNRCKISIASLWLFLGLPGCSRFDVELDGGVNVEVGPEVELRDVAGSEEGRVVVGGGLVGRVVVVGKEVEEVKVRVQSPDVEALGGVLQGCGHGHRDQEAVLASALSLVFESNSHFLEQRKLTEFSIC